jgi:hypothetical protein
VPTPLRTLQEVDLSFVLQGDLGNLVRQVRLREPTAGAVMDDDPVDQTRESRGMDAQAGARLRGRVGTTVQERHRLT